MRFTDLEGVCFLSVSKPLIGFLPLGRCGAQGSCQINDNSSATSNLALGPGEGLERLELKLHHLGGLSVVFIVAHERDRRRTR